MIDSILKVLIDIYIYQVKCLEEVKIDIATKPTRELPFIRLRVNFNIFKRNIKHMSRKLMHRVGHAAIRQYLQ